MAEHNERSEKQNKEIQDFLNDVTSDSWELTVAGSAEQLTHPRSEQEKKLQGLIDKFETARQELGTKGEAEFIIGKDDLDYFMPLVFKSVQESGTFKSDSKEVHNTTSVEITTGEAKGLFSGKHKSGIKIKAVFDQNSSLTFEFVTIKAADKKYKDQPLNALTSSYFSGEEQDNSKWGESLSREFNVSPNMYIKRVLEKGTGIDSVKKQLVDLQVSEEGIAVRILSQEPFDPERSKPDRKWIDETFAQNRVEAQKLSVEEKTDLSEFMPESEKETDARETGKSENTEWQKLYFDDPKVMSEKVGVSEEASKLLLGTNLRDEAEFQRRLSLSKKVDATYEKQKIEEYREREKVTVILSEEELSEKLKDVSKKVRKLLVGVDLASSDKVKAKIANKFQSDPSKLQDALESISVIVKDKIAADQKAKADFEESQKASSSNVPIDQETPPSISEQPKAILENLPRGDSDVPTFLRRPRPESEKQDIKKDPKKEEFDFVIESIKNQLESGNDSADVILTENKAKLFFGEVYSGIFNNEATVEDIHFNEVGKAKGQPEWGHMKVVIDNYHGYGKTSFTTSLTRGHNPENPQITVSANLEITCESKEAEEKVADEIGNRTIGVRFQDAVNAQIYRNVFEPKEDISQYRVGMEMVTLENGQDAFRIIVSKRQAEKTEAKALSSATEEDWYENIDRLFELLDQRLEEQSQEEPGVESRKAFLPEIRKRGYQEVGMLLSEIAEKVKDRKGVRVRLDDLSFGGVLQQFATRDGTEKLETGMDVENIFATLEGPLSSIRIFGKKQFQKYGEQNIKATCLFETLEDPVKVDDIDRNTKKLKVVNTVTDPQRLGMRFFGINVEGPIAKQLDGFALDTLLKVEMKKALKEKGVELDTNWMDLYVKDNEIVFDVLTPEGVQKYTQELKGLLDEDFTGFEVPGPRFAKPKETTIVVPEPAREPNLYELFEESDPDVEKVIREREEYKLEDLINLNKPEYSHLVSFSKLAKQFDSVKLKSYKDRLVGIDTPLEQRNILGDDFNEYWLMVNIENLFDKRFGYSGNGTIIEPLMAKSGFPVRVLEEGDAKDLGATLTALGKEYFMANDSQKPAVEAKARQWYQNQTKRFGLKEMGYPESWFIGEFTKDNPWTKKPPIESKPADEIATEGKAGETGKPLDVKRGETKTTEPPKSEEEQIQEEGIRRYMAEHRRLSDEFTRDMQAEAYGTKAGDQLKELEKKGEDFYIEQVRREVAAKKKEKLVKQTIQFTGSIVHDRSNIDNARRELDEAEKSVESNRVTIGGQVTEFKTVKGPAERIKKGRQGLMGLAIEDSVRTVLGDSARKMAGINAAMDEILQTANVDQGSQIFKDYAEIGTKLLALTSGTGQLSLAEQEEQAKENLRNTSERIRLFRRMVGITDKEIAEATRKMSPEEQRQLDVSGVTNIAPGVDVIKNKPPEKKKSTPAVVVDVKAEEIRSEQKTQKPRPSEGSPKPVEKPEKLESKVNMNKEERHPLTEKQAKEKSRRNFNISVENFLNDNINFPEYTKVVEQTRINQGKEENNVTFYRFGKSKKEGKDIIRVYSFTLRNPEEAKNGGKPIFANHTPWDIPVTSKINQELQNRLSDLKERGVLADYTLTGLDHALESILRLPNPEIEVPKQKSETKVQNPKLQEKSEKEKQIDKIRTSLKYFLQSKPENRRIIRFTLDTKQGKRVWYEILHYVNYKKRKGMENDFVNIYSYNLGSLGDPDKRVNPKLRSQKTQANLPADTDFEEKIQKFLTENYSQSIKGLSREIVDLDEVRNALIDPNLEIIPYETKPQE